MRILVLNGGSSSLKCRLDDLTGDPLPIEPPKALWEQQMELAPGADITALLEPVLRSLPGPVDVVGHRVVHGGAKYRQATILDPTVLQEIAREADVAPAHNRLELAAIETVERVLGPGVRQIAVFDTGFHETLPPAAYVYPGPYEWLDWGIRRFGFHGISHQYATRRAADMLGRMPARLITCHLGNGASLTAVKDGHSVDTTMGFTPLEGLMMGTRSGSIDPGLLIYLLRHKGYTPEQLDQVLNKQSGLLGVSGLSGDMRQILAASENGQERAQLAFDVYAHRLFQEIGAMLASLGGLDALVFTGGIGEHCAQMRQAVAQRFAFLGLRLDAAKNGRGAGDISAPDAAVKSLVIHAEEEWEIARDCFRLSR